MAITLIGNMGAVQVGASGAAVTPSWGSGAGRIAGDLLVLQVATTGTATLPGAISGWTIAKQAAGTSCSASIYYRTATGTDAAPTVPSVTGGVHSAKIYELRGASATQPDETGSAAGTSSPLTATAGAPDVFSGSALVASCAAYYSTAATKTISCTSNNGSFNVNNSNNGSTSTVDHYYLSYAATTGNTNADTAAFSFTTLKITGAVVALATFYPARESTLTANAYIESTESGSFTADAVIGPTLATTIQSSFTADAYIKTTPNGGSATASKTWDFSDGIQGWNSCDWYDYDGYAMQTGLVPARDSFGAEIEWFGQTFENLGVPAGATVTGVRLANIDCQHLTGSYFGSLDVNLKQNGVYNTVATLLTGGTCDVGMASSSGTKQSVSLPSNFPVYLQVLATLTNDNDVDASYTVYFDNIILEVDYATPSSFTLDAVIGPPQSGGTTVTSSFSADAYIKAARSQSLTADAYVKRADLPGSFTTDAYVKATREGSATADAFLKANRQATFSADAFVLKTLGSSASADAFVRTTRQGSATADAYLKATRQGSLTADAYISQPHTGTFTADAYIKSAKPGSFAADATISRVRTASLTADAYLKATASSSFTANAYVSQPHAGSVTADAYLKTTGQTSLTADAFILVTRQDGVTADAFLKAVVGGSFTADAVIAPLSVYQAAVLSDTPVSYWPLGETAGDVFDYADSNRGTAHSLIYSTPGPTGTGIGFTRTSGTDPGSYISVAPASNLTFRSGPFTIELWFKRGDVLNESKTLFSVKGNPSGGVWFGLDSSSTLYAYPFQGTGRVYGSAVTDDNWHHATLVIAADGAPSLYVDSVDRTYAPVAWTSIPGGGAVNIGANAYASAGQYAWVGSISDVAVYASALTADTVLTHYRAAVEVATKQSSFTGDAYISQPHSATFSADAFIKQTLSASVTADAYVSHNYSQTFTAAAYLKASVAQALVADAFVRATRSQSFTADAVVRASFSGSLTADAFIKASAFGSLTADAYLKRTLASSFTANAYISKPHGQSFTLDAEIVANKEKSGSFAADAFIRNSVGASFTANAFLKAPVGGSLTADAFVRATRADQFTADAAIMRTFGSTLTADAYLRATRNGSATADAFLKASPEGAFTAAAFVQNVVLAVFAADAFLLTAVVGSFTLDATVGSSLVPGTIYVTDELLTWVDVEEDYQLTVEDEPLVWVDAND